MPTLFDKLQDASIVSSFDQTGYVRHALRFTPSEMDVDLTGKTVLITGANSGIGFATSVALASKGATVYLLCRNPERGQRAEDKIRELTGSKDVHFHRLDLSDLDQVWVSAQELMEKVRNIDVFVHNAGILPLKEMRSMQNHELTLATNLLGRNNEPVSIGTAADWANESHVEVAKIYSEIEEGENLGYVYNYNNLPLVKDKLYKAGIRLAAVLNDIFKA